MSYRERALDLMEAFDGWDDPLKLDGLIRDVQAIVQDAKREQNQLYGDYIKVSVELLHLQDLLEYLRRERDWVAHREERELMWEHKQVLRRL